MAGLDGQLGSGHGVPALLLVAFLLGLRHASDPDHLVAVSTLVAGTRERAAHAGARLGAAWGAGHAATMLALGLPVLVLDAYLPAWLGRAAEAAIGVVVVALALRLLHRWRGGAFHAHVHEHDGGRHAHLHSHAAEPAHGHAHAVRSPAQAFALGLLHGAAGSATIAVLVVAAVPDRRLAAVALAILVAGAALSMTLLSALVGRLLSLGAPRRLLPAAVPALGTAACLFGAFYALDAIRGF